MEKVNSFTSIKIPLLLTLILMILTGLLVHYFSSQNKDVIDQLISNSSGEYLLFKEPQAPTGEIIYQTEIPSDWTATYPQQINKGFHGKTYEIGKELYKTSLGPYRFAINTKDPLETWGMHPEIRIYYSKDKSVIDEWAQPNPQTSKQILVDGVKAIKFSKPDQGGLSTNIVYTKKNTTFWIVESNGDGEGSDIYKNIISTFKVINGQL